MDEYYIYKLWDDMNEYDVFTDSKINESDVIELKGHYFFVKRKESDYEFYVIPVGEKIIHVRFA